MPEHPPTIPERIEAAASEEPPSDGIPVAPDSWRSPEDGAEQLYALWRDYNRRKVGVYRKAIAKYREEHKVSPPPPEGELEGVAPEEGATHIPNPDRSALMATVDADPTLAPFREAIRVRARVPDIRQVFEQHLERILASEEHIQPTRAAYEEEQLRHDAARSRELAIYRDIFSNRDREPDELSLLEIADLHARTTAAKRAMRTAESANPELASQLSFERIQQYAGQLRGKSHFCMTPSREHAIADLMRDAVILNRNRPLVLVGETGTGKTEVIRALARLLTGQEPARTTARDQGDPDRTLGFRAIETVDGQQRTTTAYGVIGQALTGKRTALDASPGLGAISFLDEGNKYPESFIRMLVKTLAGREPGERVTFDAWYGEQESLAPQSLLVLGMNLPDPERGRHLDRLDFSPELKREFAPTTHRLEYIPQTPQDPEAYEILLGACVDKNERVRIPKEDLAPSWNPEVDAVANTKRDVLDTAPASGGALWRLAELIAATQKRYTEARTAGQPALEQAVLDVGVAVAWMQEHQKTNIRGKGERITLQRFLAEKLAAWAGIVGTPSGQTLFRKEDREALSMLFREFRLDTASAAETQQPYPAGKRDPVHPLTVLSPSKIGALSPRVPRSPEFLGDTPDATTANATLEDGTIVKYQPLPLGDVRPGTRFSPRGEDVSPPARGGATCPDPSVGRGGGRAGVVMTWTFKGLTIADDHTPANHAVLEGPDGIAQIIAPESLTTDFEREQSREISYEQWAAELNPLLKESIRAGKSPELTAAFPAIELAANPVEFLIEEQGRFYRDRYQDPSFTIDRALLTLTPERLTEWKDALERGEADYPLVVALPTHLTDEERGLPPATRGGARFGRAGQPRTLHRVLFDRLIREKGIKIWERTDPDLNTFLEQVRDLSTTDLSRTDLTDTDGNTLAFDNDHWLAYLQALYPTLPRPNVTEATSTIGFVKWEGDPPNDRAIPPLRSPSSAGQVGTTGSSPIASAKGEIISDKSQLDAVRLRYPLATPSQWLALFAQYHAKNGKSLDPSTWSWLFGIIDPKRFPDDPSVSADWGSDGLRLCRIAPGLAIANSRLRSSR